MKCDELESYGMDDPAIGEEYEMYKVADVDAAIAELKAEIRRKEGVEQRWFERCMEERTENAELKAKLESVQASMYSDVVDANMENRSLKRALWLARAERAKEKQQLFHFSLGYEKLCIDGFYDPYSGRRELSPKQWIKVFNKVEVKLLKKAEEYK